MLIFPSQEFCEVNLVIQHQHQVAPVSQDDGRSSLLAREFNGIGLKPAHADEQTKSVVQLPPNFAAECVEIPSGRELRLPFRLQEELSPFESERPIDLFSFDSEWPLCIDVVQQEELVKQNLQFIPRRCGFKLCIRIKIALSSASSSDFATRQVSLHLPQARRLLGAITDRAI